MSPRGGIPQRVEHLGLAPQEHCLGTELVVCACVRVEVVKKERVRGREQVPGNPKAI